MHTAPPLQRRRGETLVDAIRDAVVAELADNGYDALSIEAVAERARTGKASIYRRWPNKLELVLDTMDCHMPRLGPVPDTGSIRDDLLLMMRRIAREMKSLSGGALIGCMTNVKQHAELTEVVQERLVTPRRRVIVDVLERGVTRGDVRPEALTDRVIDLGPTLLFAELQSHGKVRDADVVAIVDQVLVPLLRPAV